MEVPVDKISEIGSLLALVAGMPPETNPDYMKVYIEALGVPKKVQVVDMGQLQKDSVKKPPKSFISLICVFCGDKGVIKIRESRGKSKCEVCARTPPNLFFMNYCLKRMSGTVAVIHSIANNLDKITLENGALKKFLDSTLKISPQQRGERLLTNEEIIGIHQSARRKLTDPYISGEYSDLASAPDEMIPGWQSVPTTPGATTLQTEKKGRDSGIMKQSGSLLSETKDGLYFKFITYVSINNHLLELDGSTNGPYCHGICRPENVLQDTAKIIQRYADADLESNQYQVMLLSLDSAS